MALNKDLESIVGEYTDQKDYQTLIQYNPEVHNLRKLKTNLVQDLPISYLEQVKYAYERALHYKEEMKGKINPEAIATLILGELVNGSNLQEGFYLDQLNGLVDELTENNIRKLDDLEDIWNEVEIDYDENGEAIEGNKYGDIIANMSRFEQRIAIGNAWKNLIINNPDVYETSNPFLYEEELIPYLKVELDKI